MAKIETIFLIFLQSFWANYDLTIDLRAFGCPIGRRDFFFGFLCFCNIKKVYNIVFLVQLVCKSLFFHDLASSIF